jgi:hypothetical protein
MTGKKQALEDLLQGFLLKFGDSSQNRSTISSEISKSLQSKEKITIQDLDELEEILLYKLNPSKKQVRRLSLSPLEIKSPSYPSPTLKHINPKPEVNSTRSLSNPFPTDPQVASSKYQRKDSQIFPSPNLPSQVYNKTSSPYNISKFPSSLSPGRETLRFKHDQWGKIARAESIKFKQEQELTIREAKERKKDYWIQLSKQVQEQKLRKEFLVKEREIEGKNVGKLVFEYENQVLQARLRTKQSKMQQMHDYEKIIQEKIQKNQEKKEKTLLDKEKLENSAISNNISIKLKRSHKEKLLKQIEAENQSTALQVRQKKQQLKDQDSHQDLLHLLQVEKSLTENQKKFKEIIQEKADLAHNQERLLKFFPLQKTLKDHLQEAEQEEKLQILKDLQEEEQKKARKIKEKHLKTEEVAEVLAQQVKESEQRKSEQKNYLKEQGEIWKLEDLQFEKTRQLKKQLKREKQQEIKLVLDKQVKEKEERELNYLQLTPVESKINAKIFQSAVKVLGEE